MAKVETTLTLEQLDAALKLNGGLRAFDAGYAKGFAAGLEVGAEMAEEQMKIFLSPEYATGQPFSSIQERFACSQIAEALRARAKLEKAKT